MPATSKSQQRFFGMIAAYKDGKLDTKGLKPEYLKKIKKTAADMSTQDVEDFAKTKHDKLPEKKKDNGLSVQVYPDKKENKIVRYEDFDEVNEITDTLKRLGRKIYIPEAEKIRMKRARETAHTYAKKYHTYNRCRKEFLENVVNSPYRVNSVSNTFIDEFWSELKNIFPS
jgi:hypothetical protein